MDIQASGGAMKWWRFSGRRHCPHVNLRGIYGDAINHTPGYRRNACLDCGRLLDGPVSISRERSRLTLDNYLRLP